MGKPYSDWLRTLLYVYNFCYDTSTMRNIVSDVVVCKTRRQGDYNKQLTLFSGELGLIRATVYGAYRGRSRLSGSTEQFKRLKVYLYYNPVRQSWKVSDAEVVRSYQEILESLEKIMTASAGVEIIIKSEAAGGEGKNLYSMLLSFLNSIVHSDAADLDFILIQFIWRYIELSGYHPDLEVCPECGRKMGKDVDMVYSSDEPHFLCAACGGPENRIVLEGVRKYLLHTSSLSWDKAVKIRIDDAASAQCLDILSDYVQAVIERPIHSLKRSGGTG